MILYLSIRIGCLCLLLFVVLSSCKVHFVGARFEVSPAQKVWSSSITICDPGSKKNVLLSVSVSSIVKPWSQTLGPKPLAPNPLVANPAPRGHRLTLKCCRPPTHHPPTYKEYLKHILGLTLSTPSIYFPSQLLTWPLAWSRPAPRPSDTWWPWHQPRGDPGWCPGCGRTPGPGGSGSQTWTRSLTLRNQPQKTAQGHGWGQPEIRMYIKKREF